MFLEVPPFITAIIAIAAYLVIAAMISHQPESKFITTTCIVYLNFAVMQMIPGWLIIPYTVIVIFYFFAKSENDLKNQGPFITTR